MESAKYEEVTDILSQFDPFDVFEIGKHVKPEFVSETFMFKETEFTVEIPFDMLEVMFGNSSKDEVPESIRTPKGTNATLNVRDTCVVIKTTFAVKNVEFISIVRLSNHAISFLIFETNPGDDDTIKESIIGFSLSEPRIAQVRFWYYEDGIDDDAILFEGIGKGSVSIANFTKMGYSETGPCDVSSTEEAFDIAYHSSVYRLFRLISSYF